MGKKEQDTPQGLLYYKFDRETRNLTDNERSENDARSNKYVLHYVSEDKIFHKETPDSDFLMRDYSAVGNKHYSQDLTTKISNATRIKAESGWSPVTVPPWGLVPESNIKSYNKSSIEKRLKNIFYDCRFYWNGVEYKGYCS